MPLPDRVRLVEVGPRDGLQNEKEIVPTAVKVELVRMLVGAGFKSIEAGSFVSPKWVPQMADTADVLAALGRLPDVRFTVLTPNLKGLEGAVRAGVEEVALFAAATESFSRKNTNCSIDESLQRCGDVARAARGAGLRVRGYVSCALGCPYEGEVEPQAVLRIVRALDEMGCYEVSIGDTIGTGTPGPTRRLFETLARSVPVERLAGHFHDTYGQALANILASMELGVATFDASVAGLGGCPYAKGATGNVATEDVLYMLRGMGIATGVDLDRTIDAGKFICDALGRPPVSRAARALLAKRAA
jgi:isopropylmalate/homocitrate/citramalate synthase